MWIRRVAVATALTLLIGGPAIPAAADRIRAHDANDVDGTLDISSITHGHGHRAGVLIHRIRTYGEWRPRALNGNDGFDVWFSTDREDRFAEYRASIYVDHGALRACIGGYSEGSDFAGVGPCKAIDVRRPDPRTVVIRFAARRIGGNDYAWSASSSYRKAGSANCRRGCYDYAPNDRLPRGQIHHHL
ncbi:MAG TPA: hypothetical protein VFK89_05660 [Actinomycetota bacterium]|nr:hypothetical protein [Actinomycetota bacterium]